MQFFLHSYSFFHKSYTEWQREIDRAGRDKIAQITKGSPADWGRETYLLATSVYKETPQGYKAGYDYVARWAPVIEEQLIKGGLRLAHLLTSIYGK